MLIWFIAQIKKNIIMGDCRLRLSAYFCFQGSRITTKRIMGSSVTEESYDQQSYQDSPLSFNLNDQLTTNSPMSTVSHDYHRTTSEMSSDSFSDGASPVRWVPPRIGVLPPASPSRLGLKKHMYSIDSSGHDDLDAVDLGLFLISVNL